MRKNELIFKTKRDINGNTYYLIVDLEKRNFKSGYNLRYDPDGIQVTKKALKQLRDSFFDSDFGYGSM